VLEKIRMCRVENERDTDNAVREIERRRGLGKDLVDMPIDYLPIVILEVL
jgi:hypothetical protein